MRDAGCGWCQFVKLVVVSGVLLLLAEYHLSWWNDALLPASRRSAPAVRHHRARVTSLFNYSVGLVWPPSAADSSRRVIDRVQSQIDVAVVYGRQKRRRRLKIILRVGKFNFDAVQVGQEEFVRSRCPIVDCWLSSDRQHASSADALLISEFNASDRAFHLPKPAGQIWIAQHWESPMHDRIDVEAVRGLINWTVSYRPDSTIAISYGKFAPAEPGSAPLAPPGQLQLNYTTGKTKLVAWFVSNCFSANNRLQYARQLARFIQVDIYGACGTLSCSRYSRTNNASTCMRMLETDYKFYLAFENSNCNHYVTEKFWGTALLHKVVPIVMGARREDYEAIAPPHSFIHVDDFAGPGQLAAYLRVLAGNLPLYNEYFRWREAAEWKWVNEQYWCRLCALLHWRDDVNYVSWYDDYRAWWKGACQQTTTAATSCLTLQSRHLVAAVTTTLVAITANHKSTIV